MLEAGKAIRMAFTVARKPIKMALVLIEAESSAVSRPSSEGRRTSERAASAPQPIAISHGYQRSNVLVTQLTFNPPRASLGGYGQLSQRPDTFIAVNGLHTQVLKEL